MVEEEKLDNGENTSPETKEQQLVTEQLQKMAERETAPSPAETSPFMELFKKGVGFENSRIGEVTITLPYGMKKEELNFEKVQPAVKEAFARLIKERPEEWPEDVKFFVKDPDASTALSRFLMTEEGFDRADKYGSDIMEKIEGARKKGERFEVKAGRSSGEIDGGWSVDGPWSGPTNKVRVVKNEGERQLSKFVSPQELEWCNNPNSKEYVEWSQKMEKDINKAETLEDIVTIVSEYGGVASSVGFLNEEYIKRQIAKAEKDPLKDMDLVPRAVGIRNKVRALIEEKGRNQYQI